MMPTWRRWSVHEPGVTKMKYRKAKREINRMVQKIRKISRAENRRYLPTFRADMLSSLRQHRASLY